MALNIGIRGPDLKAFRERAGLGLDEAAEMWGLEPHVLAGVEKGWRRLTAAQWDRVMAVLKNMIEHAPRASAGPMTRPNLPIVTEREG